MAPTELAPAPASPADGISQFLTKNPTNAKREAAPASPAPANTDSAPVAPASDAKAPDAPPATVAPSGDAAKPDAATPQPYEAVMKQLNDQTKANKKLGKNNVELLKQMSTLKQELQDLKAKYDGTYVPPVGPTPEQERALMEFQARESASRKIAEEKYGAETVQAKVYAEDSPYRQLISDHPWVHQRVLGADNPVLEIFQVLEEFEVFNQFGRTPTNVLENVEKSIKDKLWKEWTLQAKGMPGSEPGKPVATLGDTRGDAGQTAARPAPKFDLHGFNRHIA